MSETTIWKAELCEKSGVMAINGPLANKMRCRQSDGLGFLFAVRLATLETADKVMFPDIDPEMLAVAHMAAAAPELFAALTYLLDQIERTPGPQIGGIWEAQAALSKASGKGA